VRTAPGHNLATPRPKRCATGMPKQEVRDAITWRLILLGNAAGAWAPLSIPTSLNLRRATLNMAPQTRKVSAHAGRKRRRSSSSAARRKATRGVPGMGAAWSDGAASAMTGVVTQPSIKA